MENSANKRMEKLREDRAIFEKEFGPVWEIYPNKKGKQIALRHYCMLRKDWGKKEIIEAIEEYITEVKDTEVKYIKQGGKFFVERIHDYLGADKTNKITEYSVKVDLYSQLLKKFNGMAYVDYLNTEHWKHFRDQVFVFYNRECQVCKSKTNLNVHHKTYDNRGRETFNDIILLCNECHKKIHGK